MACKVEKEALIGCSIVQSGVILATALAGAIAAPFAITVVTVGTVALTAGLFAAPAALFGFAMTGLLTFSNDFRSWYDNHTIVFVASSVVIFALLSGAAITAGVMLGLLTTSLMIVFIVAAVIGTAVQTLPLFKDC